MVFGPRLAFVGRPVPYGRFMRASVVHLLIALLIAIFAIGAPPPAQADCATCEDCRAQEPAKNKTPCHQKGLACQIAQTCATQLQKMPARFVAFGALSSGPNIYDNADGIAVKPAFIKPETSPPRA